MGGGAATIGMGEFRVPLHRNLPPTTVWSYYDVAAGGPLNGTYLGPTILTQPGAPVSVNWVNNLPARYLPTLCQPNYNVVDPTLFGTNMGMNMGANTFGAGAAVVHLHGGAVPAAVDGGPWAWFPPGQSRLYNYPNAPPGCLLWYHDHAMGMTRLNVYAGLAGAYLLVDPSDGARLGIPLADAYDWPLVLQDRMFDTNGQLYYPINPLMNTLPVAGQPSPWPGPSIPEFFGDVNLVNGKVWPFLNVEARMYRFRIDNGAQARFYEPGFQGTNPPVFVQIGAEQGFLPTPARLPILLLAPGERADVLVDFTGYAGKTLILGNTARAPYPAGAPADPKTVGQVMQFRVGPKLATPVPIPANLTLPRPTVPVVPAGTVPLEMVLAEIMVGKNSARLQLGPGGGPVNGLSFDASLMSPDLVPNGTRAFRFINLTGDVHPMHTHLFGFKVVQRQAFDVAGYVGAALGGLLPPSVTPFLSKKGGYLPFPNETGLKDTVKVYPGEVADVVADVPAWAVGQTYVTHCHILEHEEKDMMRAFKVV